MIDQMMTASLTSGEARPRDPDRGSIRVGFVVHVMQVAGAEVLVAETIRRLSTRIEPTILCLDAAGALGEKLQAEGVELHVLDRRPGRDWRVAGRFASILRDRRIEVIHAHQYTPFFYAALGKIASGLKPKLILTEHGRNYPDVVSTTRRVANRLILSHMADSITGVCDFSVRSLCQVDGFPESRIRVIENGIDVDRYGPARDRRAVLSRLGLDPDRRYVGHVARHHWVKDQTCLIRSFRMVAARCSDVDLLMVGDGPLRGKLEELAAELEITDRVHFLGIRHDIPEILGAIDLYALPSLSEAASLTLMEAMASGVPVVVTDVGGNPELVRHGIEGMLVPRGDREALAAAILTVLADPDRSSAMGAAGRSTAEQRFRLDRTISEYLDLYRRLAGTRRGLSRSVQGQNREVRS